MLDVSKQSEKLKSAVTDITLNVKFSANPKPKSVAHAVIISYRKLGFRSNDDQPDGLN